MTKYIVQRLIMLVPVLFGVTFLTFAIAQVTPGDPVALMLDFRATPERVAELRDQLGLNDPLHMQFFRYVWNAMHGDLGTSFRGQTPVTEEILARFPSTLQLTLAAMFIAILGGVTAGIVAATTKNKWIDGATMITALAGLSVPSFWLGLILILVLGVKLRWFPITSGVGIKDLILPAFCLALRPGATLARMTRSSILEVKREDYVRTARSKGARERMVTIRHVLRNALIPIVTVLGMQLATMLGGAVFIESVFARPGLGRFAINAILARDYPQVQGMVLFTATIYVVMNLSVDVLYRYLDPRIRYD